MISRTTLTATPRRRRAEVPIVVGLSGPVDLRTAEEEEDDDADDEPGAGDHHHLDGAGGRQLQPRHDEAAAETAQRTRHRPRQRCQSITTHITRTRPLCR